MKEKSSERYKNMSQEERDKKKEYQKNLNNWFSIKKKRLKINNFCFFLNIKNE